ncbi:MAG TPA: glycosyltransferase family 4 protein [Usitatibacter sp.]|nr:glycosyltransferase family 4 protein [Usitatibacter sp.]
MDSTPIRGGAPLRIAVVSPLYESVPPQLYGGTERVVSFLTEELVRMGHDVTLFASADSRTAARLLPMVPRSLRLAGSGDATASHAAMVHDVVEGAEAFDIVHFHIDYIHFAAVRAAGIDALTTVHGRLDIPELDSIYRRYPDMPLASISNAQRMPLPWAPWAATVYHGLPLGLLPEGAGRGGYLAFLGRISPEKRPDRAIRIARRLGMPLRIAAKVEGGGDRVYFEREIEPLLGPGVDFVGEIGEAEKASFLGDAAALLFPIDWPEPFGLVMIESMACGTPVVAFRNGSVPEIIDPGTTGWIVESEDEAVEALRGLASIDRHACRLRFEERFSASRMALDYVDVYRRLLARGARASLPLRARA